MELVEKHLSQATQSRSVVIYLNNCKESSPVRHKTNNTRERPLFSENYVCIQPRGENPAGINGPRGDTCLCVCGQRIE